MELAKKYVKRGVDVAFDFAGKVFVKENLPYAIAGAVGVVIGVTGFVIGYVRGINDAVGLPCPDNCECAGECAFCSGAYAAVEEAVAKEM